MELVLSPIDAPAGAAAPVEVVERKGLGHPDTLCDALAEELSRNLSRFYLERFERILHHNVDKALLFGGASQPAFGGGKITAPMELYLAGRATTAVGGAPLPVEELVVEGSRRWLRNHLRALDAERHILIHPRLRSGSLDLVELFERADAAGAVPRANDTSCGVGYAPASELEQLVQRVERWITSDAARAPEWGEDVKVMGIRHGRRIALTVACAFVDRHVADLADYVEKKARLRRGIEAQARHTTRCELEVSINAADDPARENLYLTVTGISAEAGDDGQAGRGNRLNGLITPYRPMTMESVAGKNPVTHVGKLYNVLADAIAADLVREIPEIREAECRLVSQIGRRIDDPQLAHVAVRREGSTPDATLAPRVERIVREHLAGAATLWRGLVAGEIRLGL